MLMRIQTTVLARILAETLDCDGNCVNDADGDGICDENEILGCTLKQRATTTQLQQTTTDLVPRKTLRVFVEVLVKLTTMRMASATTSMIASARLDACGVCNGDNSSCTVD